MSFKSLAIAALFIASSHLSANEANESTPAYRPAIYDINLSESQVCKEISMANYVMWGDVEIVVLNDESVWCVQPLQVRVASMWERLRGQDFTQPEVKFFGRPSEWQENSDINVYRCSWSKSGLDKIYEFDTSKLTYCTHIVENAATGECTFARPLKNTQLVQLMDANIQKIRNESYRDGVEAGLKRAQELK